jgi:hypothetical protein
MFRAKPIPLRHEPSILRHVLGGAGCFGRRGIRRSEWSHPALQASFANELIRRRKIYPALFGQHFNRGLQLRLDADYRPKGVSKRQATQAVLWAQELLAAIMK